MYTRDPGGRHVPHSPTTLPLRPFRRRMGPPGAPPRVPGKARTSPKVVQTAHCRRRLLPAEERLRLADAPERVPYSRQTVYYHFRKWRRDVRLQQAHDRIRVTVRESECRDRDPSGAVLDSQVVKTTGVGGPERGYDGAKRLSGRKRHLLVDTDGLALGARVHAANLHDRDAAQELLTDELKKELPQLELVWADGAYTNEFRRWAEEERGWRVEVAYHRNRQLWRYGLEEKPRGFRVLPRRWVLERTFAWLGQVRRLAKDYERLPETAVAMIYWAMSRIMLRRLARATC